MTQTQFKFNKSKKKPLWEIVIDFLNDNKDKYFTGFEVCESIRHERMATEGSVSKRMRELHSDGKVIRRDRENTSFTEYRII